MSEKNHSKFPVSKPRVRYLRIGHGAFLLPVLVALFLGHVCLESSESSFSASAPGLDCSVVWMTSGGMRSFSWFRACVFTYKLHEAAGMGQGVQGGKRQLEASPKPAGKVLLTLTLSRPARGRKCSVQPASRASLCAFVFAFGDSEAGQASSVLGPVDRLLSSWPAFAAQGWSWRSTFCSNSGRHRAGCFDFQYVVEGGAFVKYNKRELSEKWNKTKT